MEENALQATPKPQVPEEIYSPSELIAIFNSILSKQNLSAKIVYMRGIYLQNQRQDPRWSACFDTLRDEVTQDEITIKVTQKQRESLKNGNMVSVGGVLFRQVSNKGYVQLQLAVSRIEVVKEQVIDENEIRRNEIRQKKAVTGFKNVDGVLEQALFIGDRPKVALVFATVSITDADFEAGCKAAQSAIDFMEYRVNFASATDLCQTLSSIDSQGFTTIAIVRGGGGGLEHLDDIKVLETVASLKTPVIAAVGHVEEKVFIKQIVDKVSPTPNGLGAYFADIVEEVSQKKNKSMAVITEQIRKQFQEQIETSNKQNKALQERLGQITKASEESQKQSKAQIEEANKQNKALQERLGQLTKASEETQKQHKIQIEEANKLNKSLQERMEALNKNMEASQKSHNEQMTALQNQMKAQNEAADKARKEQQEADERKTRQFNESLSKMQESNTQLQKSLSEANSQGTEALKHAKELELQLAQARADKGGTPVWVWVALAVCVVIIAVLLFR